MKSIFPPTADQTIREGREFVIQGAENGGVKCPVCGQRAQVYRRSINSGMARALINQWRAVGQTWTKTRLLWTMTHEAAQLQWWGLIQGRDSREDGGRGGEWRITDLGRDYLLEKATVPKYAKVYDGELLGLDSSEGQAGIRDALGKRFDYAKLMAGEG
ncbi:hypothetical protein Cali_181 [Mycobacterium phage Cali]|uniref:Uncharacterized protein n=44 Tax=Bixzunavirus TaxID=680114 RepID=Q853C5_BPMBZ|nr:gp178 [Mycobacterium phage Bxz1]YP_002224180.1 hypothetical protein SCOTTMCG_181 [Mycobacterium phage ScottMcG]YP_002224404.1 gp183 [Mycobacterium phage Spud]YP_002224625.1 gp181 [Mycobacterium phage Cali]YP_002224846.1 gp181 [Mycobacterium phage Rizal]YP_003347825.1 hypothetical protein ET08_175 [Mycobacterium phage ET08]YP_008060958.1 hypothetical protein M181_gp169 [Mycobacterium phage Gizmo]YP_008061415.1 hypothetical protein M180_gp165 [Mycobacterium phage ArcherS7]YP_008061647.1 hy